MAQRFAIAFGKCDYFCFQISVTTDFSRKVIRSKFCKSIRLWNNIQWISWRYKSNHTLNSLVVVNQHSLLFWCIPIATECMCGKLGAICLSKEFSISASVWIVTTISQYWAKSCNGLHQHPLQCAHTTAFMARCTTFSDLTELKLLKMLYGF